MRIAIYSDNFYPELSGISDSIIRTGTELARRGHQVIYCAPRYTPKDFQKVGLPVRELSIPGASVQRFSSFSYPTGTGQGRLVIPAFRLKHIRSFNPDVFHVHLPFGVGLEGVIASRFLRKPLIGTNHTPMSGFLMYSPFRGKWFETLTLKYTVWFYNRCNFVSSPSAPVLEEMKRYGFKRPGRPISNPLDVETFTPARRKNDLKKKHGLEGFTLLYTGRLAPEKSLELILEAASQLTKKIPELVVGLVGAGSHEARLRAQVEKLGIADRVRFFGFIQDHKTLAEIYNASDVFVMPSETETQSISMMQAMLAAVPVVAVNAWGLPEYVPEGTGFIIPPQNVWAIIEKIYFYYGKPALRKKMGQAAQAFASQFTTARIADEWEHIYEQAIARHQPRL